VACPFGLAPTVTARDQTLDLNRALALTLDPAFDRTLALALALTLDRAFPLTLLLARDLQPELEQSLQQLQLQDQLSLQQLKDQLPNPEDKEAYKQWWKENGQTWTEQLRAVIIEHRNIGHDWQLTDAQKEVLMQYYDANKLLVDCLNSDCYVSREVRQEIEDTLLLPVKQ